jgi:pheromone shutdown-related protein TraB
MIDSDIKFPESVSIITSVKGKKIYLIGTAHVSKQSIEDVKYVVETVNPDSICVELCESRHKSITQSNAWEKMDIFKIIKEKKTILLFAQLILSSFYRRLGEKLDVKPGAEMIEGINLSKKLNSNLVLADRNIEITLRRVWGYLNFWNKLKMMSSLLGGLFVSDKIDEKMIEELKKKDQLENILDLLSESFPGVKNRLIDERDVFLSQKIKNAPGESVVGIIGAGHIPGIIKNIDKNHDLESISTTPPKSIIPKVIGWSIPIIIFGFFLWGFYKEGKDFSLTTLYIWVFVNGTLSAIGAAIAFAHPITIFCSFVAAPLTSLNPTVGAGMVSGLVQAIVKKPTVKDIEELPVATLTLKGWWINPVSRILLVFILSSLGSSLGTFIAGSWIIKRIFY